MNFALTDEQQMLRETAATMMTKECPSSLVRAHETDPSVADPLSGQLADWTVLGDGDVVDLALFMEEHGAVLAPGTFFATAALFIPFLRAAGLDQLADEAAAGTVTGTVAMADPHGNWVVNEASTKTFVPEADRVDHVAFVVPGPSLVVASDAVTREIPTLDFSRRVFEVDVPSDLSGAVEIPSAAFERAMQTATVALAAEMIGTARTMLRRSVDYAKERHQFGVPIGSFQAMQHKLANMSLDWERAAAAVAYSAMALDANDADRHRAVHVAKAAAGEAVRHNAIQGIQSHGGIGYTWEHDLHLFIRRAYGQEAMLGTTSWHHDRLAGLLFD